MNLQYMIEIKLTIVDQCHGTISSGGASWLQAARQESNQSFGSVSKPIVPL